jgi:hypothetical protein
VYNALAHTLRSIGLPYLRLRYEDVAARPATGIAAAAEFLDMPLAADLAAQLEGATVELGIDHTVDGNPMRFHVGPVTIRPDTQWRADLPIKTRGFVTALTAPLLLRYGYLRLGGRR